MITAGGVPDFLTLIMLPSIPAEFSTMIGRSVEDSGYIASL